MLTPVQQRAILYNLPNLVADLDVFDVMDHLVATTPSCLTPTDYEAISTIAHQKGRAAGVRCLVTCLLRRPFDSPVFAAFCSALREQYSHLADLLETSLQQPSEQSADVDCPVPDSQTPPSSAPVKKQLCFLDTPCQNLSDFSTLTNLSSLGFSNTVCDVIVLVITTVSSHPLAVLRRNDLFPKLGLTETMLQQITHSVAPITSPASSSPSVDFSRAVGLSRRALCLFFNVGLSRVLESHGSPFKRMSSGLQPSGIQVATLTTKRLLEQDLIPALEHIDCWRLASNVRHMVTLLDDSGSIPKATVGGEYLNFCALRPAALEAGEDLHPRLREQLDQTEEMLRLCTAPLYNHSLIKLNWPFILRELDVCSACILCMVHTTNPSVKQENPVLVGQSAPGNTSPTSVCETALNTYLRMALRFALLQQERMHRKTSGSAAAPLSDSSVQRVCRASVASVVHTKLLPVLRGLSLNALSDDIEQIALEALH